MTSSSQLPRCQRRGCETVLGWRMRKGTKFCSPTCRVAEHRRRTRLRARTARSRGSQARPIELVSGEWLRLMLLVQQAQKAKQPVTFDLATRLVAHAHRVVGEYSRVGEPIPGQVQMFLDLREGGDSVDTAVRVLQQTVD